jgi:hypothetical protein
MNRDLKSHSAFDFSGGLDVRQSPQQLASNPKFRNRLRAATHAEYRKTGGVSKRLDTATYNADVISSSSTAITGGVQFRHSNGTDVMVVGTDDGKVIRVNSDGTQSDLATGLTNDTRWYFDQFNDLLLITNRADAPRSWDLTTFQSLAGTPPSTGGPVIVHGNRALMLDATNPRRLSWSKLNDAENWTAANDAGSTVVTGPVGSPLVSLLRMTGEVLLGHRDYITRLQGTSPSTYAITNAVPAQVSTGVISPQGMVFAANDAYWISQRGIHALRTTQNYGDLRESFASERIDPYFTPNTDYTVSLSQLEQAVCCYDSQNNRLFFGVDTNNDGDNDTLFLRDLYTGAWAIWPNMACASLWTGYTGANGYEVFMGGYDGYIRRLNVSAATNAINASIKYLTDLGAPHVQKSPRHAYFYFGEEGNYSVSVTTSFDFGASGGQTYALSLLGDTDTLGSTFTLGTSVLGARSQLVKRLNLSGLGEFLEYTVGNAQAGQPFTWFGVQTLWRSRRVIGRAPVSS